MAARKKTTKKVEENKELVTEQVTKPIEENKEQVTKPIKETKKPKKVITPKYEIGSIVYIKKDIEADLNGFNLSISQYKKETYTVEAYNEATGVYTLRHLKLLLKLKEDALVAPNERAHDELNRKQF